MNQTLVPFSWENKPGVSKVMITKQQQQYVDGGGDKHISSPKLPPPPCPTGSRRFNDIQIPLPPCAFQAPQPPSRSSSRKGLMKQQHQDQDPFLVAFKECTKTSTRNYGNTNKLAKNNCKGMFNFSSCKRSCSVRDDNLVKISQLPNKKD